MAVVIVLESGAWAVRTWGKRKRRAGTVRFLGHYEAEVYVGIGIGAVNWAVKNLALFWWGAELLYRRTALVFSADGNTASYGPISLCALTDTSPSFH